MKTIFVSSTFADMQQERNLIHSRIMPEINDSLREQGESAKFLDFRWGVNTESLDEESAMRKVLSTCFDGILNSSYVIVFIGNRYGTSVPYPIMHDICKKYGMSTLDAEKSITELEVEFATEKNFIDPKNVIFYFKMSNDNEKEDTRVRNLKNQIKELYPLQVRYYEETLESNSESFVDLVVNDILRLLGNEKSSTFEYYENKLSLEYSSRFSCRESQLNEAIFTIFNDKLTVISGPSGSGKTVFISALRERVKDLSHTNIQYISQSCYGINLVERRVWNMLGTILRNTYNVKLNNNCFGNPIRKSLIELCQLYRNIDNKKPIFIFLDGIDKANTIIDITDFFDFIEEFCDDFHFVISISNPDLYVFPNDINQIVLSPLNRIEKLKVINYELEAFQKSWTKMQ